MTRPLRILFITDAFPPHAYGSGWSTYHLARGLRSQGHIVRIILADPTLRVAATRYDDFPVWRAPSASRRYNQAAFAASGLAPGRAAHSIVRQWKPDIIHAQHINSALIAHRAAAGTPVIVTVRDHWPICFYGTALADARCPACLHGTQTACNARRGSPGALHIAQILKAAAMRAMLAQRGRVLRSAAGVIALSESIELEVSRVVGPAAITRIPNAVDQTAVTSADTGAIADIPARFFLFAGKLSAHKGADLLPEIMRAMGDDVPPLLVVGDGDEADALHAAAVAGTPIRVLGRVPNTAVIGLMRRAIALITPARWPEPLSRTHLEALASGCPIVATDTGGTGEIVVHCVTGYLTAVGDTQAMARYLGVLATDTARRERMATAARERSASHFSLEAVTKRHVAVYEAAITRGKQGAGAGSPTTGQ
ncbi:MAG: glycosyltransferase family 4 protein [Thermomicrobiales bacterium]